MKDAESLEQHVDDNGTIALVDDLFTHLPNFAHVKMAKRRFEECFERYQQEMIEKAKQAAQEVDDDIVPNGHGKPKRGRPRKHEKHDAT
jgi:hypothetical protein